MPHQPARAAKKKPKPGRKRRALGWAFIATGGLLAVMWLASGWWWFGCVRYKWSAWCSSGEFTVTTPAWNFFGGGAGLHAKSASVHWNWIFNPPQTKLTSLAPPPLQDVNLRLIRYREFSRGNIFIDILLWPPILAIATTGGTLLWSARRIRRRIKLGRCAKCGYDLKGLQPGSPCPECGKSEPRGASGINTSPVRSDGAMPTTKC